MDNEFSKADTSSEQYSKTRNVLYFFLRLLLTILFLIWIVSRIDLSNFASAISAPRWTPFIGLAVTGIISLLLGGTKLWIILNPVAPINFSDFIYRFFISGSISSLTPTIMGDISMVGMLKVQKIPISQTVSFLFIDRIVTLTLHIFIFLPFTIGIIYKINLLIVLAAFMVLAVLIFCVFRFFHSFIYRPHFNAFTSNLFKTFPFIEQFGNLANDLLKINRIYLYYNITLTMIRSFFSGLTIYYSFLIVAALPNLFQTFVFSNALAPLSLLPITIGGLGPYEGAALLLFEKIDLSGEKIIAAFFYHRVYVMAFALVVILIASLKMTLKQFKANFLK